MQIKIVKLLFGINLVFLMAVVSALDTETIGADVFSACMLLSMMAAIVLMHILEHLKRKERRQRENARKKQTICTNLRKKKKKSLKKNSWRSLRT